MTGASKIFYSRTPQIVADRILEAAEIVFREDGFAGASTNRILELFGGSKATLFRHFPTKKDMLVGVIRRIGERVTSAAGWDEVNTTLAPEDWLAEFGARALGVILREDAIFVGRMVVAQGHNYSVLSQTFTAIAIAPMLTALNARFSEWTKIGALNSSDPGADAVRYFDLLAAGWVSRAMFGLEPPTDIVRESRAVAQLFLNGRAPRG